MTVVRGHMRSGRRVAPYSRGRASRKAAFNSLPMYARNRPKGHPLRHSKKRNRMHPEFRKLMSVRRRPNANSLRGVWGHDL